METDVSSSGIGAVLLHQGRPIAYVSKALSKQLGISVYDKEMLVVVTAQTTLFLHGGHFNSQGKTDGRKKSGVKTKHFAIIPYQCTRWTFKYGEYPPQTQKCSEFKGLKHDVHRFIKDCVVCQKNKHENVLPPGLLQPLPIPNRIWEDIFMNFVKGLPTSVGKDTILVVVDKLSKFAHFVVLKHPFLAAVDAQLFMENIFKLHGMPKSIVSDRDPVFMSRFWREYFQLHRSNSSHPPPTTRKQMVKSRFVNKCLECYLRCMTGDRPKEWANWLPLAEWWYNTSFHSSMRTTPYEVVYGQPPPTPIPYEALSFSLEAVVRSLQHREATIKILKEHLHNAQHRMKVQTDKKRSEREFAVGDLVFVKLRPYK
ncbi:UNVERIFIED_CONTAM: Gag-Pol polyprotein [Sesamum latifolium]|uniref:Gag-Pol polyprotein n=1 Tax=Sesamum latifolium TaxID=2727402 RepID=A0AAW2VEZ2_9LAMI